MFSLSILESLQICMHDHFRFIPQCWINKKVSTSQILSLQRLVECADSLSDTDVRSAICELAGSKLSSSGTDNCVSIFRKGTDNLKLSNSPGHVLLILDKVNRSTVLRSVKRAPANVRRLNNTGFQPGPYFPYFLITALIFHIWALKS